MMVLLDTCIIIDVLRGRGSALAYLTTLTAAPHISVISIAELRAGQRGPSEALMIDTLIANSVVHHVDQNIAEKAGYYLQSFGRSHALDVPDALIAATAAQAGLALATLNLKHFPMFPTLVAPY